MLKPKKHLAGNKKYYTFASVKQKQNVLQAFFDLFTYDTKGHMTKLQRCACNQVQTYFLIWVRFYVG